MTAVICKPPNGANALIWNSVVKKSVNIFKGSSFADIKYFWNKTSFYSLLMYSTFFWIIEFLNEKIIISIVILVEIGTTSIELPQKLSTNLPVTVGGIVGSLVVLTVGVVFYIFILRYIRNLFFMLH